MMDDSNSDLENKTLSLSSHCEHPKGACLHAEVLAFVKQICAAKRSGTQACLRAEALRRASVAISLKKTRLLRFTRNDNFLNRDLGARFHLTSFGFHYI
jgi:hypothetical protein